MERNELIKKVDRIFNKRGHTQAWSYALTVGPEDIRHYSTMANAKRAAKALNVGSKK